VSRNIGRQQRSKKATAISSEKSEKKSLREKPKAAAA
jgi:hypothetical protein